MFIASHGLHRGFAIAFVNLHLLRWTLRMAPGSNIPWVFVLSDGSLTLAWKIPWTEEPGELQSMGSLRVRHDWATSLFLSWLEKKMAPHSSTLAWKVSWMEEPGRLQSMALLRVWSDWATSLWLFTLIHWRRKWQPTPVFLPGESQGWGA